MPIFISNEVCVWFILVCICKYLPVSDRENSSRHSSIVRPYCPPNHVKGKSTIILSFMHHYGAYTLIFSPQDAHDQRESPWPKFWCKIVLFQSQAGSFTVSESHGPPRVTECLYRSAVTFDKRSVPSLWSLCPPWLGPVTFFQYILHICQCSENQSGLGLWLWPIQTSIAATWQGRALKRDRDNTAYGQNRRAYGQTKSAPGQTK